MKVTFKKWDKETGLAGIGYPRQSVDIKINKKRIGTIYAPNWQSKDDRWHIGFSVMKTETITDDNQNCSWKTIILKANFENEESARKFVSDNINRLAEKFEFYYSE